MSENLPQASTHPTCRVETKCRPIIFTGQLVRATQARCKTQTRRTAGLAEINKEPNMWEFLGLDLCKDGLIAKFKHKYDSLNVRYIKCPYGRPAYPEACPSGRPGDLLWVRESARRVDTGSAALQFARFEYRADGKQFSLPENIYDCRPFKWNKWTPSIHMPKWAARLWLRIIRIWVERLQEISKADVKAEGIRGYGAHGGGTHYNNVTIYPAFPEKGGGFSTAKEAFECLWDSLNAGRNYGWEANPWVWALEFERI